MGRVSVKQGSLTEGDETVLVNASNTNVWLGSGVSGAIRRACGEGYQERIVNALHRQHRGGPMAPGDVLVTDAGAHPTAKWVAHVAIMDFRGGEFEGTRAPTLETVRTGSENLWRAVEALQSEEPLSVAMVALGAGVGGLDLRESVRSSCEALKQHWTTVPHSRIGRVTFYGYGRDAFLAMAAEVARTFPESLEHLDQTTRAELEAQPSAGSH